MKKRGPKRHPGYHATDYKNFGEYGPWAAANGRIGKSDARFFLSDKANPKLVL